MLCIIFPKQFWRWFSWQVGYGFVPRRVFFLRTTLHGPNTLSHRLEPLLILLMVQKSCTTWHLWTLQIMGFIYIHIYLPYRLVQDFFQQQYHLPNLSMFYSFDVLLFHSSSLLTENEHVQTKKSTISKGNQSFSKHQDSGFFFVG